MLTCGRIEIMKNPELGTRISESTSANIERINLDEDFGQVYSEYERDMERVKNLKEIYGSESQFGKVAEGMVLTSIANHPISQHLNFRQTSLYDDYLHGADLVAEPKGSLVQAVAAIDVTTNQRDLKGVQRANTEGGQNRPEGLQKKLERTKFYTDYIAEMSPDKARNLSAWIMSGGLSEPRTNQNNANFREAEKLFLLKYYRTPEYADRPNTPTFVIGGPQTVISIDTEFINRALQGQNGATDRVADLAVMEFLYCIEAEQEYINNMVRKRKDRNLFFDQHFSKVGAWHKVSNRPEVAAVTREIAARNQVSREFREQLGYYAEVFRKVYFSG